MPEWFRSKSNNLNGQNVWPLCPHPYVSWRSYAKRLRSRISIASVPKNTILGVNTNKNCGPPALHGIGSGEGGFNANFSWSMGRRMAEGKAVERLRWHRKPVDRSGLRLLFDHIKGKPTSLKKHRAQTHGIEAPDLLTTSPDVRRQCFSWKPYYMTV